MLPESYIPEAQIAYPYCFFVVAKLLNHLLIRVRASGVQGASVLFGTFVDFTGFVSMMFGFGFLFYFAYLTGWQPAVGLFAIAAVVSLIGSAVSGILSGLLGFGFFLIQVLATIALWPLMIVVIGAVW